MISPVYLETTSSIFLVLLAGKCVMHAFVLQMHQTKPLSLEGHTESSRHFSCQAYVLNERASEIRVKLWAVVMIALKCCFRTSFINEILITVHWFSLWITLLLLFLIHGVTVLHHGMPANNWSPGILVEMGLSAFSTALHVSKDERSVRTVFISFASSFVHTINYPVCTKSSTNQ